MIPDPHPVRSGLLWGLLGVLAFSFTVPFTRVAVSEGGLPPLFVGAGRAVVAALLAAIALVVTRQALPQEPAVGRGGRRRTRCGDRLPRAHLVRAHHLVGVPRRRRHRRAAGGHRRRRRVAYGERPPPAFWLAAAVGAVCAVAFAVVQGGGLGALRLSDLLLFGAVIAAAVGYAEGGLLSRELGAWQTISWALVVAAPFMLALTAFGARGGVGGTAPAWWSFAYLGVVSMFLGFFAWYRGLAIGPMASVSQVQLAQPVFGIAWAALLLGEPIGWSTVLGGFAVIAAAALAVRTRARPRRDQRSASNSRTVTKR